MTIRIIKHEAVPQFGVLAELPSADAVVGAGPSQGFRHDYCVVTHTLRAMRSTHIVISDSARREQEPLGSAP